MSRQRHFRQPICHGFNIMGSEMTLVLNIYQVKHRVPPVWFSGVLALGGGQAVVRRWLAGKCRKCVLQQRDDGDGGSGENGEEMALPAAVPINTGPSCDREDRLMGETMTAQGNDSRE